MAYSNSLQNQAARIVFMLKKFQNGHSFSSSQLKEILSHEFGSITLRTVQRDLVLLGELEPTLTSEKQGRETIWRIPRGLRTISNPLRINSSELLSLHILKAYLKTFSGTVIEDDVHHLTRKLEEIAPMDVFSIESLYWDQNIGQYDYTQKDPILRRAIKYISEKQWVDVEYDASNRGEINSYTALLRSLFTYAGFIYAVAYIPHHDSHVPLALQKIVTLNPSNSRPKVKIPLFDYAKWSQERFGVFWGKKRKVVLKIRKDYNHYFENRRWHPNQKLNYDKDGNLLLEMRVPLATDFIAWILSWSFVITVIKPVDLIKQINLKLRLTQKNYE